MIVRIDKFEYVREDDDTITFDVSFEWKYIELNTEQTYSFCKKEKRFEYVEYGDNHGIAQLLNEHAHKFTKREAKNIVKSMNGGTNEFYVAK